MIYDPIKQKLKLSDRTLFTLGFALFALAIAGLLLTRKTFPTPPSPYEKEAWLAMICAQEDGQPLRVPGKPYLEWKNGKGLSYGQRVVQGYEVSTWYSGAESPWRGVVFKPIQPGAPIIEYTTSCGA